jgi:hypothetical protein
MGDVPQALALVFHVLATLGFLLVVAGYLARRHLRWHVACMGSAAVTDYGVLIALELTRGPAIAQALAAPSGLLRFHILVSSAALLCYPLLAMLGINAVRSRPQWLPAHRGVGRCFLAFRLANYVTSWWV